MKKVLILDDEPVNIEWIGDYVDHLGARATIVSDNDTACTFLRENPDCSLLIVDIRSGKTDIISKSVVVEGVSQEWGGLFVVNYARSELGRKSRQLAITAYTVVKEKDLELRLRSLQASYIRKGDIENMRKFIRRRLS